MSATEIAWCSHTENYLAGCTKVSAACTHCYAEAMSARLATMSNAPARYRDGVTGPRRRWTGRVVYDSAALRRLFRVLASAKKPRRVFVNSMSDTFHDAAEPSWAPLADAIRATDVAAQRAGHVIMLLTKRPQNLLRWQREHFPTGLPSWVWVGCTVEDQEAADERLLLLCEVATAGVRFVSMEPLLGPVNLGLLGTLPRSITGSAYVMAYERIHWVIAGCESSGRTAGPRRTDDEWLRSLARQCSDAGVPFFLKQRGAVGEPIDHAGVLDGVTYRGVPL